MLVFAQLYGHRNIEAPDILDLQWNREMGPARGVFLGVLVGHLIRESKVTLLRYPFSGLTLMDSGPGRVCLLVQLYRHRNIEALLYPQPSVVSVSGNGSRRVLAGNLVRESRGTPPSRYPFSGLTSTDSSRGCAARIHVRSMCL